MEGVSGNTLFWVLILLVLCAAVVCALLLRLWRVHIWQINYGISLSNPSISPMHFLTSFLDSFQSFLPFSTHTTLSLSLSCSKSPSFNCVNFLPNSVILQESKPTHLFHRKRFESEGCVWHTLKLCHTDTKKYHDILWWINCQKQESGREESWREVI